MISGPVIAAGVFDLLSASCLVMSIFSTHPMKDYKVGMLFASMATACVDVDMRVNRTADYAVLRGNYNHVGVALLIIHAGCWVAENI